MDIANKIYSSAINGNAGNPGLPANMASFLVGQSANETGGWTSGFFVNNNNCFGYSCDSGSNWQNGCSSNNADNGVTVGNYDSIDDSVQELVDYWWRRSKDGKGGCPSDLSTISTADQYASILHSAGYYTSAEANYAANIKAWVTKLGSAFLTH